MSAADSVSGAQLNWGKPGYGPNPKENTQGMLFSNAHAVNKAANAAARTGDEVGHKGYSENRLNQVREKLPVEVHYADPASKEALMRRQGGEAVVRNPSSFDPESVTDEDRAIARKMTTQHVHDVVARSSMPTEDLEALHPNARIRTQNMGVDGAAGMYNRHTHVVSLHGGLLDDERTNEGAEVVMHELGHGVDAAHSTRGWDASEEHVPGKTTNIMPMSSPEAAATGEGFADAYALRHTRGRGGAPIARSEVPYENYSQQDWENYSGFGHDQSISPQERGPSAYFEARATHGAAKQLGMQFD